MELPGLDASATLIHQPVRLRIMGLLYRQRDVAFTAARDILGVTDGNLATHVRRLEAAGFLSSRRALQRHGFEVRYRITAAGSQAFRSYIEQLRTILEAAAPSDDLTAQQAPKRTT